MFTKNSSGLIIDHMLNYVQINVGGDVQMINGELYLNEGGRASLSATRFALSETNQDDGIWSVSYSNVTDVQYSSTGITARGINIIPKDVSADGHTYLQTSESQEGGNYDIKVWYTLANVANSVIIHIVGV